VHPGIGIADLAGTEKGLVMTTVEMSQEKRPVARQLIRRSTIATTLIVLGAVGALWVEGMALSYPSNVFPEMVFIVIAVLAVLVLVSALRCGAAAHTKQQPVGLAQKRQIVAMVAATVVYVLLIAILGFYFSTWLFLFLLFSFSTLLQSLRSRLLFVLFTDGSIAAIVTAVVYGCFSLMLQVPTPTGLLF